MGTDDQSETDDSGTRQKKRPLTALAFGFVGVLTVIAVLFLAHRERRVIEIQEQHARIAAHLGREAELRYANYRDVIDNVTRITSGQASRASAAMVKANAARTRLDGAEQARDESVLRRNAAKRAEDATKVLLEQATLEHRSAHTALDAAVEAWKLANEKATSATQAAQTAADAAEAASRAAESAALAQKHADAANNVQIAPGTANNEAQLAQGAANASEAAAGSLDPSDGLQKPAKAQSDTEASEVSLTATTEKADTTSLVLGGEASSAQRAAVSAQDAAKAAAEAKFVAIERAKTAEKVQNDAEESRQKALAEATKAITAWDEATRAADVTTVASQTEAQKRKSLLAANELRAQTAKTGADAKAQADTRDFAYRQALAVSHQEDQEIASALGGLRIRVLPSYVDPKVPGATRRSPDRSVRIAGDRGENPDAGTWTQDRRVPHVRDSRTGSCAP